MKKNVILTACLLLSQLLCAQQQNLDKLPQKERDSILIEIANEAFNTFTEGYLRPGNEPHIEDIGCRFLAPDIEDSFSNQYINRHFYTVYYLPTEEEKDFFKKDYLIKAFILADVGKVSEIRVIDITGYWRGIEKRPSETETEKWKHKPVEVQKKELEELRRESYLKCRKRAEEKIRGFQEMSKEKQDSILRIHQRFVWRNDSLYWDNQHYRKTTYYGYKAIDPLYIIEKESQP